jgi:hypothetical protein
MTVDQQGVAAGQSHGGDVGGLCRAGECRGVGRGESQAAVKNLKPDVQGLMDAGLKGMLGHTYSCSFPL